MVVARVLQSLKTIQLCASENLSCIAASDVDENGYTGWKGSPCCIIMLNLRVAFRNILKCVKHSFKKTNKQKTIHKQADIPNMSSVSNSVFFASVGAEKNWSDHT